MVNPFKNIDKEKVFFITGLALCALGPFALYGSVSYLFTWKVAQDLMDAMSYFDETMRVSNAAGRIGFRWGAFLVGRCFGLAALIPCAVLCWIGVRMVM